MPNADIAAVRAFNRFYTRQIGLLNEHVAASRFTLAEGRLLYEIGQSQPTAAADLAIRLRVDPAYLSRLLKTLLRRGLIAVAPSPVDRRRSEITTTPEGRAAIAELEALNDASIEAVLGPLSPEGRQALTGAMDTVRTLLGGETPAGPVVLRPHRLGEIGWLIHRQGLGYNQQFGWNIEFEGLIARIYGDYHAAPATPPKNLWVAEQNGAVAGSIFVEPSRDLPGSAQLRMLFVEPWARGQGIGKVLVAQAVSFAREGGYERLRLWTHTHQEAARRLYAAAGMAIVETMDEHNFGGLMTGEIWEMRF